MRKKLFKKFEKGISLIDTVSASVILMVIVSGTLHYRYFATLDIEKAKKNLDAVEITVALSQAWQGANGVETFDTVTSFSPLLTISEGTGESAPDGYTLLGKYDVQSDDVTFHTTMSYKDIDSKMRHLNLITSWINGSSTSEKTFQMTSYVYSE